jgi:hypothetical protein
MYVKTVTSSFTLKQSMVIYSKMSVVDVMLFMLITPQQESWSSNVRTTKHTLLRYL